MSHITSIDSWSAAARAACLLSAVLLFGCGGGGGGGGTPQASSTTPPPTTPTTPVTPPPAQPDPPPPTPPAPTVVAPSIDRQPEARTVAYRTYASFNVVASGTAPLSYQWKRNGVPIASETMQSFSIPSAAPGDDAVYSVVVSNSAGQVESNAVKLTVLELPGITTALAAKEVVVGEDAVFVVIFTGSQLTYEWRRNGVVIPGATESFYTLKAAQLADSGATFEVIAANAVGRASSSAPLTVHAVPPEHVAPAPMSFLSGLASVTDAAGEQHAAEGSTATITLARSAFLGTLPASYAAKFMTKVAQSPEFYYPIDVSVPQDITLNRRVQGNVAGVDLDRYDGVAIYPPVTPGGDPASLVMNLLNGMRSGFRHVGVGNWKLRDSYQPGYFAGFKIARGSFIVGQPSADLVVPTLTSGTYRGYSHGGLEFELLVVRRFEEYSSVAEATYDATSRTLTLTLNGFKTYTAVINSTNSTLSSLWPQADPDNQTILTQISLTCNATIDPSTNAFTCPLADANSILAGVFHGRFYGPDGSELAGTFALTGVIRYSADDGIVGSVALKR